VGVRKALTLGTEGLIDLPRLETLLADFPRQTIGLVGDLFLDRYLDIDPELRETSIETGLEAYQVTRVRNSPGALGTVINNLAALGVGRLLPVTVLGDDGQAYDLLQELANLPVDPGRIIRDPARLTPTYTKPMQRDGAGVWRELNRLDLRNRASLSRATEERLLALATMVFAEADGLIVLDQVNEEGWGVVGQRLRDHLAGLCRQYPAKLVFVDSRRHIRKFRFGVLKPNVAECLAAIGEVALTADAPFDLDLARRAAKGLSQQAGRPLFCTLGERGMLVADGEFESKIQLVAGFPVSGPVDVVGAGDSATAGIVASLLAGASSIEAATIGNLVASVTVQQIGTTGTASPAQVVARWRQVSEQ
jgi:bifunctional ADP-heptose synthase (sugar kinase/adenylyltransferase)